MQLEGKQVFGGLATRGGDSELCEAGRKAPAGASVDRAGKRVK